MKRRSSIFKKYFYVLFLFAFFISTPAHAGFWGNLWNFLISPIAKPIQLIFGIDIRTNNNNTTTRSSNPNSNIDTQTNEYDSKEEDSILDDSNNRNKKKVNTTKEAAPPIPDDKKDKNNGLKKDIFGNQELSHKSEKNLEIKPQNKNSSIVKKNLIKPQKEESQNNEENKIIYWQVATQENANWAKADEVKKKKKIEDRSITFSYFQDGNEQNIEVNIPTNITFEQLQQKIEKQTSITVNKQKLICNSKELTAELFDQNKETYKNIFITKKAGPPIPDDKKDKNNGLKKDNFRNQEIEIDRLLCKKESKENLKVRPPSKNGTTVKEKPIKLREQKKTQVRFLSFAKELKQRKPTTKVAVKKPLLNEVTITNIRKTLDRLYRLHAHSKHNKEAQLTNAKREWSTFITEQTKIYNNNFVKNPISDQQFAELYIKQSRIEKEERERENYYTHLKIKNKAQYHKKMMLEMSKNKKAADDIGTPLILLKNRNKTENAIKQIKKERIESKKNKENLLIQLKELFAQVKEDTNKFEQFVRWLIKYKPDKNIKYENFEQKRAQLLNSIVDKNNNTLLHYATMLNSIECVFKLIQAGVDVNAINTSNLSALHIAVQNKQIEIIQLLRYAGIDQDIVENTIDCILKNNETKYKDILILLDPSGNLLKQIKLSYKGEYASYSAWSISTLWNYLTENKEQNTDIVKTEVNEQCPLIKYALENKNFSVINWIVTQNYIPSRNIDIKYSFNKEQNTLLDIALRCGKKPLAKKLSQKKAHTSKELEEKENRKIQKMIEEEFIDIGDRENIGPLHIIEKEEYKNIGNKVIENKNLNNIDQALLIDKNDMIPNNAYRAREGFPQITALVALNLLLSKGNFYENMQTLSQNYDIVGINDLWKMPDITAKISGSNILLRQNNKMHLLHYALSDYKRIIPSRVQKKILTKKTTKNDEKIYRIGVVHALAYWGADLNVRDKKYGHPIVHASSMGYTDIVEFLCKNGSWVNNTIDGVKLADDNKQNLLSEIVLPILSRKKYSLDTNGNEEKKEQSTDMTASMLVRDAAEKGDTQCISKIVATDPNAIHRKDTHGLTAAHRAALAGNEKLVHSLIGPDSGTAEVLFPGSKYTAQQLLLFKPN